MFYVKIGGTEYPATNSAGESMINGTNPDYAWGGRDSKAITLTMAAETARTLFVDGTAWSIVQRETVDGVEQTQEFDNSAYCVAGDITDHRDGTMTVRMGRPTAEETAKKEAEAAKATLKILGYTEV